MRRKHMNLRLNNKGMALLTVMLVMLVLSILATGVIVISVANFKQASTTVDHSEAYYVAEAGVNYQVSMLDATIKTMIDAKKTSAQILAGIDTWATGSNKVLTLATVNGVNSTFTSSSILQGYEVNIVSTGTISGVSRTLSKKVRISGLIIDKAILTSGVLNIDKTDVFLVASGNYGPVQSLSGLPNSVMIDPLGKVGEVTIPTPKPPLGYYDYPKVISGCDTSKIIGAPENMTCQTGAYTYKVKYDDSISKLPSVVIPIEPTVSKTMDLLQALNVKSGGNSVPLVDASGNVVMSSNSLNTGYTYLLATSNSPKLVFYVPKMTITGTVDNFYVDIGNNDIVIIAEEFILGGSFKIKGTGSLTVFVKSSKFSYNCGNGSICGVMGNTNPYVSNQFRMVITGTEGTTLDLSNNTGDFYMSLITNLNLNLSMKGNGTFNGFLATSGKTISFQGTSASHALIYAPNALVDITGNASLTGSIISESYVNKNSNSTDVTYDPAFSSPPFDFLNPFANLQYGATIEN